MSHIRDALHKVTNQLNLSEQQASAVMKEILEGQSTPALTAAFLIALRMKGETAEEVTGFVRSMRAAYTPVRPKKIKPEKLVDTCGTGGDGGKTFNISTVSAIVAAGAGVVIAKHGNRAVSSKCGSADVLESCGVKVNLNAQQAAQSIDEIGIGFLFAQAMHPAMRHAGPVRKELGMRTVFNILGPLTNPADARNQVIGVYATELIPLVAEVLQKLGVSRALVVHSQDGLDEISINLPTNYSELKDGVIQQNEAMSDSADGSRIDELTYSDFGLDRRSPLDSLAGGDVGTNKAILESVLSGEAGSTRDIVVANAAAAICLSGLAGQWREGATRAAESIDSGAASAKLAALVEFSQSCSVDN